MRTYFYAFTYCWFNLFRDVEFALKLLDTLVNYINKVAITYKNIYQPFYFHMKIFHSGANFKTPEQNACELNLLVGIENKTAIISKNSTKCGFAKNRSSKLFVFAGNIDI